MIKVNLLLAKKKKKQKPVPAFLIYTVLLTIVTGAIMAYIVYFFDTRLSDRETRVKENDKKISELKEKIKAVEDFERLNRTFQQRKDIIEELGRNKTRPVKILDEISLQLPAGVWMNSMEVKSSEIRLECTAFSNTDVVNYVNNLKNSKIFTDVYLQESVQAREASKAKAAGIQIYTFKLVLKVKS
jgi:type IV pilus assembly protein PilN